jgi:hypothetical protein
MNSGADLGTPVCGPEADQLLALCGPQSEREGGGERRGFNTLVAKAGNTSKSVHPIDERTREVSFISRFGVAFFENGSETKTKWVPA